MAAGMASDPVMVCVDGSVTSMRAAAAGLALVRDPTNVTVVVVAPEHDPMLVTGGGFVGSVVSPEEMVELDRLTDEEAQRVARNAVDALGLPDAAIQILRGGPGPALCAFAADVHARAIVMGTRGRGGIKRAVLGSVADHVVRNAPCPVIVTGPGA
jgi:nucleotide-binding universal stress UspA family protein